MVAQVSTPRQRAWLQIRAILPAMWMLRGNPGRNQKDYTRRMQEFFDHFLKGAAAPEWMEKGIPYLQREKEKEKYRVTDGEP